MDLQASFKCSSFRGHENELGVIFVGVCFAILVVFVIGVIEREMLVNQLIHENSETEDIELAAEIDKVVGK